MAKPKDRIDEIVDHNFDQLKAWLDIGLSLHEIQANLVEQGVDPEQAGAVVIRAQKRIRVARGRSQGMICLIAGGVLIVLGLALLARELQTSSNAHPSGTVIMIGGAALAIGIYKIRSGQAGWF